MARIEKIAERAIGRPSSRGGAEATYAIIDIAGETHLQIDTYGSPGRAIPGKVSQSLQFGPEGLRELRRVLDAIR